MLNTSNAVACLLAAAIAGAGLSIAPPVRAEEAGITLGSPIDCSVSDTCFIQNYVDAADGPEKRDYRCGFLTYDGHTGTDFRIPDLRAMAEGVRVLAAQSGTVRAVRDGMADAFLDEVSAKSLEGRECGNGVVIDHDGGWQTQYCHLKRGSVGVSSGQVVAVGDELGLVGLSGNTEFPHLEFLVRHRGSIVDPFVGTDDEATCGKPQPMLWEDGLKAEFAYRTAAIFGAGFSGEEPALRTIESGALKPWDPSADVLYVWVRVLGLDPRNRIELRVRDEAENTVLQHETKGVDRPKAQWLAWAGLRRPEDGWSPGPYRADLLVRLGNETVSVRRVSTGAR